MTKHYDIRLKGVCARSVEFDLEDGIVKNVQFIGGCRGNTTGVAKLAEGMRAEEIIKRLKGTLCRDNTSCPDQFARALESALVEENK